MAKRLLSVAAGALGGDVREAAGVARGLGFEGVLCDAYGAGVALAELSGSGRREFRHALAGANQTLVGLRGALGGKGLGVGADVDRVIWQVDRAMECAKGLSAPLLCLDLGALPHVVEEAPARPVVTAEMAGLLVLPEGGEKEEPKIAEKGAPPDPAFVGQVDGAMAEIGGRADRYGVMVALRSELSSLASLERVIRAARCPWFGVDLDPVGMLRDEWGMDEVFSRLGGLVRHVRARDAVVGQGRRVQPMVIGKGGVKWDEVLGRLDEAGYGGAVTVDPTELGDRVGGARAGGEYLRSLIAAR